MASTKLLNSASNNVKTAVNISISNKMEFCVTTANLSESTNDGLVFQDLDTTKDWLDSVLNKTLIYKPLNAKALENMAKKGLTPKKQPGELLVFVIVDSEKHIHLAINFPESYQSRFDLDSFKSDVFPKNYEQEGNVFTYEIDSPLKERDNLSRKIFAFLKKTDLYQEEEEDDDEMVFNLNEIV